MDFNKYGLFFVCNVSNTQQSLKLKSRQTQTTYTKYTTGFVIYSLFWMYVSWIVCVFARLSLHWLLYVSNIDFDFQRSYFQGLAHLAVVFEYLAAVWVYRCLYLVSFRLHNTMNGLSHPCCCWCVDRYLEVVIVWPHFELNTILERCFASSNRHYRFLNIKKRM